MLKTLGTVGSWKTLETEAFLVVFSSILWQVLPSRRQLKCRVLRALVAIYSGRGLWGACYRPFETSKHAFGVPVMMLSCVDTGDIGNTWSFTVWRITSELPTTIAPNQWRLEKEKEQNHYVLMVVSHNLVFNKQISPCKTYVFRMNGLSLCACCFVFCPKYSSIQVVVWKLFTRLWLV